MSFFLIVTGTQARAIRRRGFCFTSWFGNGGSVPLKRTFRGAFLSAPEWVWSEDPRILRVCFRAELYARMLAEGMIQELQWIDGIRVRIDLLNADVDWGVAMEVFPGV